MISTMMSLLSMSHNGYYVKSNIFSLMMECPPDYTSKALPPAGFLLLMYDKKIGLHGKTKRLLPSRMVFLVEVFETFVRYVGVYLRGGYVGVAEHRLNDSQVRPALEQVRCEGMAYYVGFRLLPVYAALQGRSLYNDPEVLPGHAAPAPRDEEILVGTL